MIKLRTDKIIVTLVVVTCTIILIDYFSNKDLDDKVFKLIGLY